ncbi:NACHT domain-containing protein [Sphaerisporangium sp. NPDC004334]
MRWERGPGPVWAAVCGLLVIGAAAASGSPRMKLGDVDPIGAVIGLSGLALTVVSVWLAVRAQRVSEMDLDHWARRLAVEVRGAETGELRKLLGDDDQADKPIDVRFVLLPTRAHQAGGVRPSGCLTEVVEYYRRLRPGRLVITGAAGAGKTVLALRLLLGLLAAPAPGDRVPVRLSATQWDTATSLQAWVAAHLVTVFRMPRRTAAALVKAGRILPVIDGLDEMDIGAPGHTSRAADALRALNSAQDGLGKMEVVLTCRTDQYAALDDAHVRVRAQDAAHIRIEPVDTGTAQTFLETRVGVEDLVRWGPVLDALDFHPDGALARALDTPWRLTLAVTVYRRLDPVTGAYLRDPAELTAPDLDTPAKIGRHLLAAYIPAATTAADAAGRNPRHYSPDQIHRWLAHLARYLNGNAEKGPFAGRVLSGTDLVLHQLWPLAGDRPRVLAQSLAGVSTFVFLAVVLFAFHVPHRLTLAFIGAWVLTRVMGVRWPEPWRIELPRMRTPLGHRKLVGGAISGLVAGAVLGLVVGFSRGWAPGLAGGLTSVIVGGLGFWLLSPGAGRVVDPRDPIRNDLACSLVLGLQAALLFVLMWYWLMGSFTNGLFWLLSPLVWVWFVQAGRRAVTRYLMLILCTRGRLPWRLGRFLHWCHEDAGLLRVAGVAYQFRHRELQDYLARFPAP